VSTAKTLKVCEICSSCLEDVQRLQKMKCEEGKSVSVPGLLRCSGYKIINDGAIPFGLSFFSFISN